MLNLAATPYPLAATHGSDAASVALAVLVLVVVAVGYLLTCWIWPFGRCPRCKGLGKRKAPLGRVYRICLPCEGTGYRVRIGRRVINHLRATHRAGTR